MNVPEICPICHKQGCCCKNDMVRFFDLLNSASQRVLSDKPSSNFQKIEPIKAGIDKLNGNFTLSISPQQVLNAASVSGFTVNKVYLKDRSQYLKVSLEHKHIHLKLDVSQNFITAFIANPNHFKNWGEFIDFFKHSTGLINFDQCIITRLDLNIDYPIPFQNLIGSIDIVNKRTSLSYNDVSGERTGLHIGKGNETITIYDKSRQLNLASPLTRIELRLKQNKLPCKNITDIPKNLSSKSFFDGISLLDIKYHQPQLIESKNRLERFKAVCQREGYFIARKLENKSRNFDRDFKNLIAITHNHMQPNEQFKTHISDFINPTKREQGE